MEISQAIKIRFTKVVFQVIARIFLTSIENHFQFLNEDNLKKGGRGEGREGRKMELSHSVLFLEKKKKKVLFTVDGISHAVRFSNV